MCELLGMSSNRPATVDFSLMRFAEHGGLSGPHRDGWGISYYEGRDVRLIKEAHAAADSEWVRFVADHELRSQLVISHIRKATQGARTYANAQPFVRELGGRMHVFVHNGFLSKAFEAPEPKTQRFFPVGETDSEDAFCTLLNRLTTVWTTPYKVPAIDARLAVISEFSREMRSLGVANFLYSDGDTLFAHGDRRKHPETGKIAAPGLVHLERHCTADQLAFVTKGLTVDGGDQTISLIASVPLTDEHWRPLARGELLAIQNGNIVQQ